MSKLNWIKILASKREVYRILNSILKEKQHNNKNLFNIGNKYIYN